MIIYNSLRGRCFKFNEEYPVYDSNDNQIGTTSIGDIGIVVFDDIQKQDYAEVTLATGKYAGYDALALNKEDFDKATYIGVEDDMHVSIGYRNPRNINDIVLSIELKKAG